MLSQLVHPRFAEGSQSLPEVDYLILLDKLYVLSYALVVLTLAMIVRNAERSRGASRDP